MTLATVAYTPENTYVAAGVHRWNAAMFQERLVQLPGRWWFVTNQEGLAAAVEKLTPRYAFFLHWPWRVPPEILDATECVCFHETDVPFGRGGSPIQNLIARGHDRTVVSALRMVEELDAGPVYLKLPLSLDGLAEEIFIRANAVYATMIEFIVKHEPVPSSQVGEPVVWQRRRPHQSNLLECKGEGLWQLFDFIRMLDADGYPLAYLDVGPFRITFSRPALRTGLVVADATFEVRRDGE